MHDPPKGKKEITMCSNHGDVTLNQCTKHPDSGNCYVCHLQEHLVDWDAPVEEVVNI